MDKYALNFTKDARVIGHLKKGKTGWYANTVFYFGRAYPMNTAIITVTGNRVNKSLQIPLHNFIQRRRKIY